MTNEEMRVQALRAIEEQAERHALERAQEEHDQEMEYYDEEEEHHCDDCGEYMSECECAVEEKAKPIGFDKVTFINSLKPFPDAPLLKILEPLTEKTDILKAVFEYRFKPAKPTKAIKYRQAARAVKFVTDHNAQIDANYIAALEAFHKGTMAAFKQGAVGEYVADFNQHLLTKAQRIDEAIFTHPLFKVVQVKNISRSAWGRVRNLGTRIKITTREEVFYSYQGNRLNFGKFTFNILLDRGAVTISFSPCRENFTHNACPYISQSKVCMGENSYSIRSKIITGKIAEAMTELYTTMTEYNTESTPFRGLDYFFADAINGNLRRRNGTKAQFTNLTTNQERN